MKERWQRIRDADGEPTSVHELYPAKNWRCRVWIHGPAWNWEARRFGRSTLHVSGECDKREHAKAIAVAAVQAIRSLRR